MGLAYCREAKKLLEIYGLAVHEVHQEQFESVIGSSMRFDDLIYMANEASMKRNMCTCTIWRLTPAQP